MHQALTLLLHHHPFIFATFIYLKQQTRSMLHQYSPHRYHGYCHNDKIIVTCVCVMLVSGSPLAADTQ